MSGPARRERQAADRAARILSALASTGGRLTPGTSGRYELNMADERGPRLVAEAELVGRMRRNDWLCAGTDGSVSPTDTGLAWLRRRNAPEDPWRGQHLVTETAKLEPESGPPVEASVVANESPLAWLRRRRGTDGRPLVSELQFRAGERLRADFERGRLGPRVTADWTQPAIGRNRRGPGGGGPADLLDAAVAARQRVDAAVRALGPDLGSLLLDVCCFLVGLEDAERRRSWPRRSAKVVLAIALDRLAEHYGLSEAARGADRSRRILHWGDADYRPRLEVRSADAAGEGATGVS